MKKLLWSGSIMGLCFFLFFGTSSLCALTHGPKGDHPGKAMLHVQMLEEHSAELGLTEAQLEKIRGIYDKSQKEIIKIEADLKIARIDLRAEMEKDRSDRNKVSDLIDALTRIEAQLKKSKYMSILEVKEILTPEQLTKIKTLRIEKRMERHDHRSEMRQDRMADRRDQRIDRSGNPDDFRELDDDF